tara:strand:+ start:18 stop:230 length:213 start_codon:yes stop_codon:yes gene_type:complete
MAYKQKYTRSAFPFKASFDAAFNSVANANKIKKTVENSEVPKEVKLDNGVQCGTFDGRPHKYDKNGLIKK